LRRVRENQLLKQQFHESEDLEQQNLWCLTCNPRKHTFWLWNLTSICEHHWWKHSIYNKIF
jgi:hypothetical protein